MNSADEARSELSRELSSKEQMLWTGKPKQGVIFRPSDFFLIPFSVMWCGFAVFWEYTVLTQMVFSPHRQNIPGPMAVIFPLWGIPFVLIGLYMVFGRFFVEAKARETTYYGVTSDRILIKSGLFSRTVKSLNLRTLLDLSFTEGDEGRSTITFGPANPWTGLIGNSSWPGASQKVAPSFDLIPDARRVYELIREAQTKAIKGNP
jgi:hypothetical protein